MNMQQQMAQPPQFMGGGGDMQQQLAAPPPHHFGYPPHQQQQPFGMGMGQIPPAYAPPAPFKRYPPRGGRVHHHLPVDEAKVHAFQLGIAQQYGILAQRAGTDIYTQQKNAALSMGVDPARLAAVVENDRRLDGMEPPLGLMLIRDEHVYSHMELIAKYPHLAYINFTPCSLNPTRATFILVTAPERIAHLAIKYGMLLVDDAKIFNNAFNENFGVGYVYVLFASSDAGAFTGIAEMKRPSEAQENSTQRRIPLHWIFVKNIPFHMMPFIKTNVQQQPPPLPEEQKKVTVAHVDHFNGVRALILFANFVTCVSILMDFKYFDEAEAKGVEVDSGYKQKREALALVYQNKPNNNGGNGYYNNNNNNNNNASRPPYQNRNYNNNGDNLAGGGRGGYQSQTFRRPFPPHNNQHAQSNNVDGAKSEEGPAGGATTLEGGNGDQSQQARSEDGGRFNNSRGGFKGPVRGRIKEVKREITSSDGEKISLDNKFTFQPTYKKKQGENKRSSNKDGAMGEDAPKQQPAPSEEGDLVEAAKSLSLEPASE